MDHCALVLDDGSLYEGYSFGSAASTVDDIVADGAAPKGIGEVVFNTSMSGYHEVLTDPSYTGQIVAMTYPHIGNYGCDREWNESRSESGARGGTTAAAGMVVREVYGGRVGRNRETVDAFLNSHGTPGIAGIDTRRLTLSLRDHGSRNGAIVRSRMIGATALSAAEVSKVVEILCEFPSMIGRDLVAEAGGAGTTVVNPTGRPHVALLDCGVKANIIRELVRRKCRVTVVPSSVTASEIRAVEADALLVSNGPGDPAALLHQVESIGGVIGTMPVFGICLGHQLIAQSLGATTYKMSFGHHGVNHPVRDELTGRVFVTSQNHGFAVEESSLPDGCDVWFRNANDGSIEGISSERFGVMTTQFHPEAAPGPRDALWVLDEFMKTIPVKEDR